MVDLYFVAALGDASVAGVGAAGTKFFIVMALQFALVGMGSALRGTGIVNPAMLVQVLTIILNTILAPVLIAGWGPGPALGVRGAGLASSISVAVGVALLTLYFIKLEKYVSFQRRLWRPKFELWRRMFNIGRPAGK